MKKLFAVRTWIETAALVLLLLLTQARLSAQSALDGFDPNANGVVHTTTLST